MPFPDISPVAFYVGVFPIRWYGLAYAVGLLVGPWLAKRYVTRWREFGLDPAVIEAFAFWAIIGVIVGGRIGYILFYRFDYYSEDLRRIFYFHEGGMSFHGGFLGVAIAAIIFCRGQFGTIVRLTDVLACVAPIGLFFGRLANFVNAELWGRMTTVPWGVIFPNGGPYPRHPSALYEAALEGLLMFVVLNVMVRSSRIRETHGLLTGLFIGMYGLFRFLIEFVREPDSELIISLTRGQFYSVPMIVFGIGLVGWSLRPTSASAVRRARMDQSEPHAH